MRLEIFDFIDDTIALAESLEDVLEDGTNEIEHFFR